METAALALLALIEFQAEGKKREEPEFKKKKRKKKGWDEMKC